ncbi:hypothetical protein [Conservatibacter flavescens]|uniref:Uncharacterized protein n=1 Tax=Conservatibacter flavescens TaxID=28161 RepID=A0A2M8RZG9_9PAST|nr:hypothetical protein [Conservatibacter flavescens]PJG84285.1 hypothetical protein CVP05_12140 [Conservatibacter flavescens]
MRILFFLLVSLPAFAQNNCAIENQKWLEDITSSTHLKNVKDYAFSRNDVSAIKELIYISIDHLLDQKIFYKQNYYIYDCRFNKNIDLPKKIFEPIKTATIKMRHLFIKPTQKEKGIYDYYISYLEKRNNSSHWNYSEIVELGSVLDAITDFSENDFMELGLVFKKKQLLKNIPLKEITKYYNVKYDIDNINEKIFKKIENKSYAIYEYEAIINKVKFKFIFCVSKFNYMENAQYPNKWNRLIIERLD